MGHSDKHTNATLLGTLGGALQLPKSEGTFALYYVRTKNA